MPRREVERKIEKTENLTVKYLEDELFLLIDDSEEVLMGVIARGASRLA